MSAIYKLPLVLDPQPEGGFTVTCPVLPELITEGDSLEEALENVRDALRAVVEIYEDLKRPLPVTLIEQESKSPVWLETAIALP